MEYEQDDKSGESSLLDRIKESPRTVSALIIIVIVAAAIYAFSGNDQQPEVTTPAEEAATTETQEAGTTEGEVTSETAAPQAQPAQPVSAQQIASESAELPEASRTDEGYVETAVAGDGVTHLARRAATRYLSENEAGYAITNEHRIYIEDYIKDNIGSRGLALGENQTISFELIKEAITAAGQLNEQQLKNLSKYTYVLT